MPVYQVKSPDNTYIAKVRASSSDSALYALYNEAFSTKRWPTDGQILDADHSSLTKYVTLGYGEDPVNQFNNYIVEEAGE